MPITKVEIDNMDEILADLDAKQWNWYTCHLLRLIARADGINRRLLKTVYPAEVTAWERWYIKGFAKPKGEPIIHILMYGVSLCHELAGILPYEWPEGHKWVGAMEAHKATCEKCKEVRWSR